MTDTTTEPAPPTSNSPFSVSRTARRFLAGEFRKRWKLVAAIFVGGALNAFLEVTGLALVFPLLAVVMRPEAIQNVPYAGEVVSALGVATQSQLIAALIVAIALVTALKNVYMVSFYWWQSRAVARWKADLSRRMMRLYVLSDLRMHMEKSPGTMIRNLSYTGIVFDQYVLAMLLLFVNGIVAIGIATLLALALPGETLFGVGTLAIGATAFFFGTRGRIAAIGRENDEIYKSRSLVLQSGIGAIRESKILGREKYFLDRFTQIERHSFERQGHYNFLASLPGLGLETIIVLAMLAVIAHVIFVVGAGPAGLATIGLLAAAMFRLLPMILRMMVNLQLMNLGKASLEIVAKEIEDCEHRVRVPNVGSDERFDNWRELQLNNVGFVYPDGTRALQGVTLTIPRGEFVGITGPSGSGKSTLMLLLLGLVEPTEGTISIDGQDFADPEVVRRWQNGIGYVPQGLFLVDGSLAENVAFGAPTPDLERVRAALTAAQLAEYVDTQPEGILAPVGDYGERLSGGQKQRVVIARALYRDPDVIAFDEATSTLDVLSEKALTDHVLKFKSRKSLLAIAHRLKTIQHCDRIIFLEAGRLAGFGSFDALKQQSPGFQQLAQLSNL
jgi:ABC-type multidrug transport system fused ATPase/permease subunit